MNPLVRLFTLFFVVLYPILIGGIYIQKKEHRAYYQWLLLTIVAALLVSISLVIPDDFSIGRAFDHRSVIVLSTVLFIAIFGKALFQHLSWRNSQSKRNQVWWVLSGLWFIGLLATILLSDSPIDGDWLDNLSEPFNLIFVGGLITTGGFLLIVITRDFMQAHLPEMNNRALYWLVNILFALSGVLLVNSSTPALNFLGNIALSISVFSAIYLYLFEQIPDVRHTGLSVGVRLVALFITTFVAFVASVYIGNLLEIEGDASGLIVLIALGLVLTALYIPVQQLVVFLVSQLTQERLTIHQALRKYNLQITQATSRDEVTLVTIGAINQIMHLKSSQIIFTYKNDQTSDSIEFVTINENSSEKKQSKFPIPITSPIYKAFTDNPSVLTQYAIETSPKYKKASAKELQFFQDLGTLVYAPIVSENKLIGLLACGAKIDKSAFSPHELNVLISLTQEVSIALRTARLVDNLTSLNTDMESLNKGLQGAKQELEILDSVKTDFVTIASHELRTPLAQIRGYNDIIESLNDQGMLDQEQTRQLAANLRKATEHMGKLIAAMLDMSQLDINAMDLNFVETKPESIVRMSIDSLTDAMQQRKITLTARGLRNLPNVQADMQRIVQAFNNIIVNAVKFTPDGGSINIRAEEKNEDDRDYIQFEIQDSGVGVDPKHIDYIFAKFYRGYDPSLHSTGTYKFMGAGPGLGLTIAKGIIEGHGGRIWAESPGHDLNQFPGSTFFITLPIIPPAGGRIMRIDDRTDSKNPLKEGQLEK